MDNKDIKYILQYPIISEVDKILVNVNLKEKERAAIEFVDRKGYTEERASKILQVSKRSIQNYRKKAYEKLNIALENNLIVIEILKAR
ncbi:MAG: helix-turn-helix transcriptional regulator [Sarcina sp.]